MAAARYWRIRNLEAYAAGPLELTEIRLLKDATRVDAGATLTASITPGVGAVANLVDNNTGTKAVWASPKGLVLHWDFGVATEVSNIAVGSALDNLRFPLIAVLDYSSDNVTWTELTTFGGIAWPGPLSMTETDPPSLRRWESAQNTNANNWSDVAFGNGVFVAVQAGTLGMYSSDGLYWTGATLPSRTWNSIAFGNGVFVAVASTGTGTRVATSPDGSNWTIRNSAADLHWADVIFANGIFVAVSANTANINGVMTSPDGITWTRQTAPSGVWTALTYGAGVFLAAGGDTAGGSYAMTSPDGVTWTMTTPSNLGVAPGAAAYGNGIFVIVTRSSATTAVISSDGGATWSTVTGIPSNSMSSVTFAKGRFIAVSASPSGVVVTSINGTTWESYNAAASLYGIAYGDELFVAVGRAAPYALRTRYIARIRANKVEGKSTVQILHSVLTLGAAASYSGTVLEPTLRARTDFILGGEGRVAGTVKENGTPNTPVRRKVRLIREKDGLLVQEQWSNASTGAYDFQWVQMNEKYTVLSYDHLGNYRAVVADRLDPELMP